MAKKKSKRNSSSGDAPSRKKRVRRTPEQIIADLQTEIQRLRNRQKARELKQSPSFRSAMSALKSIDKALDVAAEAGETATRHALADARRALAGHLEKQGLELPKANLPKGPRPK